MAAFTTRVELHGADYDDYEILHAAMERRGFSRFIKSGDGITYHLPTAEYNYIGSKTSDEILALSRAAAAETRKKYSVLVTESSGRKWYGLIQA